MAEGEPALLRTPLFALSPDSRPRPYDRIWRPSSTVRSALAPVAQAASVLERGAEFGLRAQF